MGYLKLKDLETKEELVVDFVSLIKFRKTSLLGKFINNRNNDWGIPMNKLLIFDNTISQWNKYIDLRSVRINKSITFVEPLIVFHTMCACPTAITKFRLSADNLYIHWNKYTLVCKRKRGYTDDVIIAFVAKLKLVGNMRDIVINIY